MTLSRSSDSKKSDLEKSNENSVLVDKLSTSSFENPEKIVDVVKDPYEQYNPEEREILYRQVNDTKAKVAGYMRIITCGDKWDYLLQLAGSITAIGSGLGMPLMSLVAGKLAKAFTDLASGRGADAFQHDVNHFVLYFVYIAVGVFGCSYIYTISFIISGERISRRIRQQYLHAVLSQNIGYFDRLGAGEITTRITSDTNYIQDGLGEKVGLVLFAVATFVSGFVVAFIRHWKFTLIISSMLLAILGGIAVGVSFVTKYTKAQIAQLSSSSTFVEEVFSNIRNAFAFGTQGLLADSYTKFLNPAKRYGINKAMVMGLMIGWMFFVAYGAYGLAFWEGGRLLHAGELTVDKMISCFFAVLIASYSLANISPKMQAFVSCSSAAKKIFDTIDRPSPINAFSPDGEIVQQVHGEIELKNIRFVYPTRPEVIVLDNFSLLCPAGKITALVGASGSGKSTIVGLVERFYDPIAGQVMLDGKDLRDLNTASLRGHISLVQQEPVLFGATVYENIAFGLTDEVQSTLTEDELQERVFDAAKIANAYDFIMTLPEKFDTNVGQRGFLMSGGQKQRIAIARAIISDPKILLLDEATSALDSKSEVIVQKALDNASRSRTTIVIAHRLSTIRNADNIVVVNSGKIIEQGTHNELLALNGAYSKLVEVQQLTETNNDAVGDIGEEDISGYVDITAQDKNDGSSTQNSFSFSHEKEKDPISLRNNPLAKLPIDPVPDLPNKDLDDLGDESPGTKLDSTSKLESNVTNISSWKALIFIHSFIEGALEIIYMIVGILASMVCGAAYPVQAVVYARFLNIFTNLASPDYFHKINLFGVYWLILAIAEFFGYAMSQYALSYILEAILQRIRWHLFRTILRQDVEFFDRTENTVGALTTSLSTSIQNLEGLTGSTLGTFVQILTNVVSVSILSLATGWKLALVTLATSPVIILAGYYRVAALDQIQDKLSESYKLSAAYACESTSAIRTVASLTRESKVYEHYCASLVEPGRDTALSSLKSGLFFSASQAVTFLVNALAFWYGATLMKKGEYNLVQFYTCFISIVFGIQQAGQFLGYAADVSKAKSSAGSIKYLCDSRPKIDTWSEEGRKIESLEDSSIIFNDVEFRYPTRKHIQVLRGLNLTVKPGQFVAFVGASGCGKSTTIGLIERFYDCEKGSVIVGGVDIRDYNINDYRKQIALVSQEPTLYQGTIRDNIVLGASRDVTDKEIIDCCKMANIHDFIMGLPNGYETLSGQKGSSLSGGQKQRIAIARALIRNPKILLLDEATSALDSHSEKVVQEALNKASEGRTTVAIAHRLSSIQHADCIFVFDGGVIAEAGTHNELVKKRGRYYELVVEQGLGIDE
ncbi:leptomycin efflux transporter Pmd1 [Schizosaccharomyces cryophilus OY26]|uniref:Leptomycin efflux transporter Pmd1 n=1 Tax=Schizosaccharomyces cryophilus (strain OY26 / ATCC MYA-4695 / CBS 11777 / NBRC 106824 / NRRL Y48691) TaxID=653667 RepID=S9W016_SCHCR|nr:leptomycin efflux transporter Pmd1 [Schizosaccharomyces cryophilus OY26]EPY51355.1 leptomycin efflux transporter Pmd1 [Schizosaccharomyces cryophilus OY26]